MREIGRRHGDVGGIEALLHGLDGAPTLLLIAGAIDRADGVSSIEGGLHDGSMLLVLGRADLVFEGLVGGIHGGRSVEQN